MQEASAADDEFGRYELPTQSRRPARGYVLPMDYSNASGSEGQPRRRRRRRRRSRYGAIETFVAFSAVWVIFVAAMVLAEAMAGLDVFFIREVTAPILEKHGWLVGSNLVAHEGGIAAIGEIVGMADHATAPLHEESQSEILWGRVAAVVLVVPLIASIVRAVRRHRRR